MTEHGTTPLTAEVADFVAGSTWDCLDGPVVAAAIDHILDSYGVMLAGVPEEGTRITRAVYGPHPGECTVVGTDRRQHPVYAALVNAVAGHALDYDDTQLSTRPDAVYGLLTHPSVPVLAAVTAAAEVADASGRDLITGFVAGVEVACRIADAIDARHYQAGFHSTGTIGAIGAAAGASRVLGSTAATTARALGIAASMGAGLRENFGTMTKPLHSGRAAHSGVAAALLAAEGFTASDRILEARRGFFNAAGGGYRADRIHGRLGNPYFLVDPGVSIKPYPSGSLSHPAQDVIFDLIARYDLTADNVASVQVGTNSNVPNALIHHRPVTGLEGKFSMEYCIATAIVRRRAGLAEFTDAAVTDPRITAFLPKVTMVVDPELEAMGYEHVRTQVRVITTDGRELRGEAEWARGHPARPMTMDELDAKFLECAGTILDEEHARRALAAVRGIPGSDHVGEFLDPLRRG